MQHEIERKEHSTHDYGNKSNIKRKDGSERQHRRRLRCDQHNTKNERIVDDRSQNKHDYGTKHETHARLQRKISNAAVKHRDSWLADNKTRCFSSEHIQQGTCPQPVDKHTPAQVARGENTNQSRLRNKYRRTRKNPQEKWSRKNRQVIKADEVHMFKW